MIWEVTYEDRDRINDRVVFIRIKVAADSVTEAKSKADKKTSKYDVSLIATKVELLVAVDD
jgi:hypothetical protein